MGRIFVITGGGTGLGRAFARTLAADGETVILLGRRLDKVQAVADEIGNGAFALSCDVSDPASVDAAFAEIARIHPRIDGLINNAAVFWPFLLEDARNDQIDAIVDINLKGVIHAARAAIPLLGRGGAIINIGSETVAGRVPMFSLYQGSKAGMERFNQALQQELAESGIRVTLYRVCRMADEDSAWDVDPATLVKFRERSAKAGVDQAARPIASFASAAAQLRWLVNLPPDLQVNEVIIEARAI